MPFADWLRYSLYLFCCRQQVTQQCVLVSHKAVDSLRFRRLCEEDLEKVSNDNKIYTSTIRLLPRFLNMIVDSGALQKFLTHYLIVRYFFNCQKINKGNVKFACVIFLLRAKNKQIYILNFRIWPTTIFVFVLIRFSIKQSVQTGTKQKDINQRNGKSCAWNL